MASKKYHKERQLIEWIIQNGPASDHSEVGVDLPILESGLLDSLSMMDMVEYIEKICNRPIAMGEVSIDNFYSIRTISANFFEFTNDVRSDLGN